jgi:hypothetical protein
VKLFIENFMKIFSEKYSLKFQAQCWNDFQGRVTKRWGKQTSKNIWNDFNEIGDDK